MVWRTTLVTKVFLLYPWTKVYFGRWQYCPSWGCIRSIRYWKAFDVLVYKCNIFYRFSNVLGWAFILFLLLDYKKNSFICLSWILPLILFSTLICILSKLICMYAQVDLLCSRPTLYRMNSSQDYIEKPCFEKWEKRKKTKKKKLLKECISESQNSWI